MTECYYGNVPIEGGCCRNQGRCSNFIDLRKLMVVFLYTTIVRINEVVPLTDNLATGSRTLKKSFTLIDDGELNSRWYSRFVDTRNGSCQL